MLNGYITAVVTPFKNGKLDIESFEKYINYVVSSGVSGMVVCGSTGESLALSAEEKFELIKKAADINGGRITLLAGAIDSVTENCVNIIKKTESLVDGFLCICPFYIKPSQEQIYRHFKTLSDATSRNIILYNNPGRVGTSIGLEAFKKSCALKNVVAIKECSPDLSRFTLWRSEIKEEFVFFTGNDDSACGALAMGADGVISVSANVAPALCAKMYAAFKQKDIERFNLLRDTLAPLHELMFEEPSPAPVKYALSKSGLMSEELRAPLSPISAGLRKKIDAFMEKVGI